MSSRFKILQAVLTGRNTNDDDNRHSALVKPDHSMFRDEKTSYVVRCTWRRPQVALNYKGQQERGRCMVRGTLKFIEPLL
jgi:hypothetical protein